MTLRAFAIECICLGVIAGAATGCNGFTPSQPGNGGAITINIPVSGVSGNSDAKQTATHSPGTTATGGPQSATADVKPDVTIPVTPGAGTPIPVP